MIVLVTNTYTLSAFVICRYHYIEPNEFTQTFVTEMICLSNVCRIISLNQWSHSLMRHALLSYTLIRDRNLITTVVAQDFPATYSARFPICIVVAGIALSKYSSAIYDFQNVESGQRFFKRIEEITGNIAAFRTVKHAFKDLCWYYPRLR